MAYIKVIDRALGLEGLQSPILKFIPEATVEAILQRVTAESGDIIFFGAGTAKMVSESLALYVSNWVMTLTVLRMNGRLYG